MVVDTSALVALVLEDEPGDYAEAVLARIVESSATVPAIFSFEIRNVLVVNERRERLTRQQAETFLAGLRDLPIEIAPLPSDLPLMDLARDHRLSVYDAAYLELAKRLKVPLATLDRKLRGAAEKLDVPVF